MISQRHVLTGSMKYYSIIFFFKSPLILAAHCVIKEILPKSWSLKKVRLGEWDRTTDPDCQEIDYVYTCAFKYVESDIAYIHTHEDYDFSSPNKLHDIAMLRLTSTITFSEFVRPICLPSAALSDEQVTVHGTATVIGFGMTEAKNSSERLMKAELDIVNHRECERKYRLQGRQIVDSQICAIKYRTDTW